jgi:hypothetical protein
MRALHPVIQTSVSGKGLRVAKSTPETTSNIHVINIAWRVNVIAVWLDLVNLMKYVD